MSKVRCGFGVVAIALGATLAVSAQSASAQGGQSTILYGAVYYNEYMPEPIRQERLQKDVDMMKAAGISVVRMGESTWSLWEPSDGTFAYAWMDRVVDAMGKAGIKVILGTPTYSMPVWMAQSHPEFFVRPLGGAQVTYGMRQNMDYDNPQFRAYAQRVIEHIVEHYKNNPTVIGWQLDNETGSYGASNSDVFSGFVEHLKEKFVSPDAMNQAWFLNYWGQDVSRWEDMPPRDQTISTGYKLEWERWQQIRVTRYIAWQAQLVRKHGRADQFLTHNFGGVMKDDVDEKALAQSLDVVGNDPYHQTQDHFDGAWQAQEGDYSRSLKHANYLVLETNAQTLGWNSAEQFPPYDGQLRLDVYTHIASGANMVEYWHWSSIHAEQETYWKGVLSHDLEPNRAYAEVSRTAHELQQIGPKLVNMKIENKVAILYSSDSFNAISFMPFERPASGAPWEPGVPSSSYTRLVTQLHRSLYNANVGTDFVFPDATLAALKKYKLLIVPALYIADDRLLQEIAEYVKTGGHVLMTFKSGFANENSAVRWELAPGLLRDAAGFTYQEFSNLEKPLALQGDPFHAGEANEVRTWAEFLKPTTAQPLAYYDHPFFKQWPAITENHYGTGTLLYEGTLVSDTLQAAIVKKTLGEAGLLTSDAVLPASIRVKHGLGNDGRMLHYYLNYSGGPVSFSYRYKAGKDLLTGKSVEAGSEMNVSGWDVAIVQEAP